MIKKSIYTEQSTKNSKGTYYKGGGPNIYLKQKDYVESELNKFPSFYAFDKKQFQEGLKELNVKEDEVVSTGYGGYIRKSDKDKYMKMWQNINKRETELMKNDRYLYQGIRYELGNHEYGYTYDAEPALRAVGLNINKLTPREKEIFEKAKSDYLKYSGG